MHKLKLTIRDRNGKKFKVTIKGDFDGEDIEHEEDWAQVGDIYIQPEGKGKITSVKLTEVVGRIPPPPPGPLPR